MGEPKRIRRERRKGWRMPAGARYVGRPSRWGNRFVTGVGPGHFLAGESVRLYRVYALDRLTWDTEWLAPIRGKDLVCWCPLPWEVAAPFRHPCHADVLLELANRVDSAVS